MMTREHWELFLFLAGLIAAWSLIMAGVQKFMMSHGFSTLKAQMDSHLAEMKKVAEQNQCLERQFLEFKADLPLNYVRKEDFIRHEVVINTKLDRLRDLIEDVRDKQKEMKNAG